MSKTAARGEIVVRDLESADDLRATADLYREVFGIEEAVNVRLLTAIRGNGGVVIGAFDGADMVGYAYGFLGSGPAGELYHYSQTAAVRQDQRERGVGTLLKLGQRERVLAQGIERMRWAFDPLRTGNARFNLDVLGASARWFAADLYRSGEAGGTASDRLIVEWDLRPGRASLVPVTYPVPAELPGWGETAADGADVLLTVPRTNSDPRTPRLVSEEVGARVIAVVRELVGDGYEAVSCLPANATTAVYRLRRWRV